MRRRKPLSSFGYLFILLQQRLGGGSSFLHQPKPTFTRHGQVASRIKGLRIRYNSDANGFESARVSNSTSAIANGAESSPQDAPIVNDGDEIANGEQVPLADAVDTASWTRNVYDYAKAAAGTLGDIMAKGNEDLGIRTAANLSEAVANRDGLVTSAISSGTLASRFGIEHPLDRMALTANGNLQRLISSYYDAPVEVLVDYCHLIQKEGEPSTKQRSFPINLPNGSTKPPPKRWDRLVRLKVHNQTFCRAHSIITVHDPVCQELVESGEVGLGQLFRYLDILPEFELHNAGPYPAETGGGFWREYSLKCAELSCDIHEDFRAGIWDLHPSSTSKIQ